MTQPIKVLLVDDHAVVRMGYRALLQTAPDMDVVGEAESGEQACRWFADRHPQVVIMDISLPGMGGLGASRRILQRDPSAKILMFSMHEEAIFAEQALTVGALGYLTKRSAPDVLLEAIRQVAAGNTYVDATVAQRLVYAKTQRGQALLDGLTPREFEIFQLLANGMDVNQAARRLSLSYKTVANYSTQLKLKLNARTAADLARIAIRHGIISV